MMRLSQFATPAAWLSLVYGVVMTVFSVIEVRAGSAAIGIAATGAWQERMFHYAALSRAFDPLVFYTGFAVLIVAAANILEARP